MKKIIMIIAITVTTLLLSGCATDAVLSNDDSQVAVLSEVTYMDEQLFDSNETSSEDPFGSSGALADMEFTIEEMIVYAIQDEYAAKAEYTYIIDNFDVTRPFSKIIPSEETHISLLLPLFESYQIDVPLDTSSDHLISISSLEEAFSTGVLAEELNIAMYNLFLSQEDLPSDLIDVFTKLRDASLNHLAAFQNNLDRY